MKSALLKVTCDLYAPESVLSPTTVKWLEGWGAFASRRTIYPVMPLGNLTIPHGDAGHRYVTQDFFHMRFATMDGEYQAPFDSGIDYLLSVKPAWQFFGEELHRMAAFAMNTSPSYRDFRTYAAWVELWEHDEERQDGRFVSYVNFPLLVEKIKTPG